MKPQCSGTLTRRSGQVHANCVSFLRVPLFIDTTCTLFIDTNILETDARPDRGRCPFFVRIEDLGELLVPEVALGLADPCSAVEFNVAGGETGSDLEQKRQSVLFSYSLMWEPKLLGKTTYYGTTVHSGAQSGTLLGQCSSKYIYYPAWAAQAWRQKRPQRSWPVIRAWRTVKDTSVVDITSTVDRSS